MNAVMSLLVGVALFQGAEAPVESPAVEPAPPPQVEVREAPPPVVTPAPETPGHARRASSVPVTAAANNTLLRRIAGGMSAGAGAVLVGGSLLAMAVVAFAEYSHWPDHPKAEEYPRHTISMVGAATAAACLMLGAVAILGGLAALF